MISQFSGSACFLSLYVYNYNLFGIDREGDRYNDWDWNKKGFVEQKQINIKFLLFKSHLIETIKPPCRWLITDILVLFRLMTQ